MFKLRKRKELMQDIVGQDDICAAFEKSRADLAKITDVPARILSSKKLALEIAEHKNAIYEKNWDMQFGTPVKEQMAAATLTVATGFIPGMVTWAILSAKQEKTRKAAWNYMDRLNKIVETLDTEVEKLATENARAIIASPDYTAVLENCPELTMIFAKAAGTATSQIPSDTKAPSQPKLEI